MIIICTNENQVNQKKSEVQIFFAIQTFLLPLHINIIKDEKEFSTFLQIYYYYPFYF